MELRPGSRVLLHGLMTAELNGTIGRLHTFHEDRGRWAVTVGRSAPKLLKPCNLKVMNLIDSTPSQNLVEVLGEDLFLRICHFLPAVSLIWTSFGNSHLQSLLENVSVWRSLCYSLLDEAVITLHLKACDPGIGEPGYEFWKTFFRAAWTAAGFFYEHRLREECLHSSECFQQALQSGNEPGIQCIDGAVYFQMRQKVLGSSGHTASALKSYILSIGGWRPWSSSNDLHVTVLDLKRMMLIEPAVAGSEKPERRLRHSSCTVRDFQALQGQHSECVLVLGGCNDKSHVPCAGLKTLLFLTLEAEGSAGGRLQIRWRKEQATGQVPSGIWHHAADSFSKGTQVIVFGGDVPPQDPEFTFIGDRAYANYVYILDVNARRWERVQTQGQIPHWRSLHFGGTFFSSQNSAEHFVIMGGCEEHLEIFRGGPPATMLGYSLNLQTLRWRRGVKGNSNFLPAPRMRFGAQRYGRHVLVYGGHGADTIPQDEELLVLNSETLEWRRAQVINEPSEFGVAPAAALAGGCVLGGVQLGPRGAYPVPKLDFICLNPFGDIA